ncbi:hypothetical protein HK096_003200 [Nowakowskiella sp. JEL0078]|nr:hypothetical protein HK096_003200 [Nowakowskiella sp. JEL0078]
MPPEIILGMDFNLSADVFSYGVILFELLTGILAEKSSTNEPFHRVIPGFTFDNNQMRKHIGAKCPEAMIELAVDCSKGEPEIRPQFTEILKTLKDVEESYKVAGLRHHLGAFSLNSLAESRSFESLPSPNSQSRKMSDDSQIRKISEIMNELEDTDDETESTGVPHRFSVVISKGTLCSYCKKKIGIILKKKMLECDARQMNQAPTERIHSRYNIIERFLALTKDPEVFGKESEFGKFQVQMLDTWVVTDGRNIVKLVKIV